jgi:predicted transcriptional regulator
MKTQKEILERIMSTVNREPVTFMQLCRGCGFNYRTVKRQLEIIEYLQKKADRIEISRDGFRVIIRKISDQDLVPSV